MTQESFEATLTAAAAEAHFELSALLERFTQRWNGPLGEDIAYDLFKMATGDAVEDRRNNHENQSGHPSQ